MLFGKRKRSNGIEFICGPQQVNHAKVVARGRRSTVPCSSCRLSSHDDSPKELGFGSDMACWRYLRDWQASCVSKRLHPGRLTRLREHDQIAWSRASVDGAATSQDLQNCVFLGESRVNRCCRSIGDNGDAYLTRQKMAWRLRSI